MKTPRVNRRNLINTKSRSLETRQKTTGTATAMEIHF